DVLSRGGSKPRVDVPRPADEGGLSTSFASSPYRRNWCRRPVADLWSAHDEEVCPFACCDTHLPKAFAPFGWFAGAYFFLKAALLSAAVPRSALHAFAAFSSAFSCSCASCWASSFLAFIETHLPKALAPFGWSAGAYFFLNAAMLSAVVPRSALHIFAAFF